MPRDVRDSIRNLAPLFGCPRCVDVAEHMVDALGKQPQQCVSVHSIAPPLISALRSLGSTPYADIRQPVIGVAVVRSSCNKNYTKIDLVVEHNSVRLDVLDCLHDHRGSASRLRFASGTAIAPDPSETSTA